MATANVLAAALSVVAAAIFTASFAMQQRANLAVMSAGKAGARTVMSRREWIGGIVLQPAGFVLQAVALGIGSLIVVETALTAELAFMAPAGAWVIGARPQRKEWIAGVVVLVGLAAFMVGTRPAEGLEVVAWSAWALPLAVLAVVFLGFFAAGQALPAYQAALRGAAAGTWGALMGALTKQVVATGEQGFSSLITGWATWTLIVTGLLSILWVNLALRSGHLAAGLSAMASATPVVSVFLGLTVFDEQLASGSAALGLAAVGVVVMGVGISQVARSPSLLALEHTAEAEGGGYSSTMSQRSRQSSQR